MFMWAPKLLIKAFLPETQIAFRRRLSENFKKMSGLIGFKSGNVLVTMWFSKK